MPLGVGEILLILFVLLVVFSASRMGTLGNALGKFVYSFKKAAQGKDLVDVTPSRDLKRVDDPAARGTRKAAPPPSRQD